MGLGASEVFYLEGFHYLGVSSVPVFFLLSGFFLTLKEPFDYQKNLKKKFNSLVIPYCCTMLLYALISYIGSFVAPKYFGDFSTFTAHDWLMRFFGIPFLVGPKFYGPLWFVRELLIFNILSFILVPAVKKIPGYILFPVLVIFYFLPIPKAMHRSIPFFLTGLYFGTKKSIPVSKNPIFLITLFIIGFTVPMIFLGEVPDKISVLLMTGSILMISEKLVERDSVKKMAKKAISYSFPIYLLHEYPMTTMMRLLAEKHISMPVAVAAFFIAPFLVGAVCICVIDLWKRLSPKTYALCTGGR